MTHKPAYSCSIRPVGYLAWVVALAVYAVAAQGAEDAPRLGYNEHIRPILSDNCFACHGPDKNHREADLRLDQRDSAVGNESIVPGKPDESELVRRILSSDPDERMPPPESHKKLSAAQKELIKRWIAEGAEYEPHWAYITPKRPETPRVKNAKWVRNPLDAFILQALEARKLGPSREADRRMLLRRLSLDLIGLPPTPAEVEAFVSDTRRDAYERQVDRLLASPHFGERMAVAWLDAVRFADTVGFHGDQNQNIFPYRDYVIDAFNNNKPFDQFTLEQLAGDLLPNPTEEQLIATGFNRLNMMTREGGAQPKEYLAKYAADRVRTVSQAFLSATMGCCECHDHKYDPFTTRDFYALSAFFADVKQWGVYQDYGYTPNPDLKGFSNDHPFPPEIKVASPYLQRRRERLRRDADRLAAEASGKLLADPAKRAEFDRWRQAAADFLAEQPTGWVTPAAEKFRQEADGSLRLPAKGADNISFTFPLAAGTIAAIRLEALPDDQYGGKIVRGGEGSQPALTLAASVKGKTGKQTTLAMFQAEADAKEDHGYANGYARHGVQGGWKVAPDKLKEPQTAVYLLANPNITADGDTLIVSLAHNPLGRVRISISPLAPLEPIEPELAASLRGALAAAAGSGGQSNDALLHRTCVLSTNWSPATLTELRKIQSELAACMQGKTPTLVTVAVPPVVTRVLPRGNWQDESGKIVEPATPEFLTRLRHGLPTVPPARPKISSSPEEGRPSVQEVSRSGDRDTTGNGKGRLTRLDLTRWIVAPENPLTSRAIMNRMWKQFFGAGLSGVVEDLGGQGQWPSHPQLLDWLAVEFRESKWDVKHMVRLIVTSGAYRQDSRLRKELLASDPENRLLSSQNPRRLEAEFVRDNALFISGLINLEMGGPSAKPYQPAGYYDNLQFPDRHYVAEKDDRQYRRGVYVHWQRTFLHPMLANFDAPPREDATCTRIVSNTPQQALTLLNDPEFVEAARAFAQRIIGQAKTDPERFELIFQLALCRAPKPQEVESLARFLKEMQRYYSEHPGDAGKLAGVGLAPAPADIQAVELATWTSVCRVVLNLHETITRY